MTDRTPAHAICITEDERETLCRALEMGYFEWPRAVSLTRIADDLGRTDIEVLEQLSTGMGKVLRETDVLEHPDVISNSALSPEQLDELFDVLQHPYRRRILTSVQDDNPLNEAFVIDRLATREADRSQLATELYHAHLPRLAELGYINWEKERRTIRRGSNFDVIAPTLRRIRNH